MSRLIYGGEVGSGPEAGIELSYIQTKQISHEVILDPTGTDYLHTKITITVQALIHHYPTPPATPPENRADTLRRIRHMLETPRRQLYFFDDSTPDVPLIMSPAPGTFLDAANGPFPENLHIDAIKGTQLAVVSFTVSTCVIECPGGGQPPYQSNLWRDVITIDEKFFTTRTRTGRIMRRSDGEFDLEQLRDLAFRDAGLVPPGFQRERSTYTFQEDGLALAYEFVDKELYLTPPAPAVFAEGTYRESTNTVGGAIRWGEANVRLVGANVGKDGDFQRGKQTLLAAAILVAGHKVGLGVPLGRGDTIKLYAATVEEKLFANEVSVMMRVMLPKQVAESGIGSLLSRFGHYPAGSNPTDATALVPDGGVRGSAQLMALASALGDPCFVRQQLSTNPPPPDQENLNELVSGWSVPPPPAVFLQTIYIPRPPSLVGFTSWPRGESVMNSGATTELRANPNRLTISTTQGPVTIQVAKPEVEKTVRIQKKGRGEMPKLVGFPRPLDGDGNKIPLMGADIQLGAPKPAGDGEEFEQEHIGEAKFAPEDAEKANIGFAKDPLMDAGALPPFPFRDPQRLWDISEAGTVKAWEEFLDEDPIVDEEP